MFKNPFHHETSIKKTAISVFLISFILLTILGLLLNRSKYQTYIFLTVAPSSFDFKQVQQPELNSFYLVSAANIFAETVQGWVNTPTFLDEVNKTLSTDTVSLQLFSIKAKKDTQQNLTVYFTERETGGENTTPKFVIDTLQKHVNNYNNSSSTKFNLVNISNKTIDTKLSNSTLFALILFASLLITLAAIAFKKLNHHHLFN